MNKLLIAGLSLIVLLAGCKESTVAKPPSESIIIKNLAELYLLSGVAVSVEDQIILGKHHEPGSGEWRVVACANLVLANESRVSDCNDSFRVYQLDTGKWVINGVFNGSYRWIEVSRD